VLLQVAAQAQLCLGKLQAAPMPAAPMLQGCKRCRGEGPASSMAVGELVPGAKRLRQVLPQSAVLLSMLRRQMDGSNPG
jgi:hypothetical protein